MAIKTPMTKGGAKRELYGGVLKWWYPTTIGFPTKNDHFGVFWGYHHLRKHPYIPSRKPSSKVPFLGDTLVPRRVHNSVVIFRQVK